MGEPSQAAMNLTPEEKRLYGQLFQEADTDKLGIVTGEIALKFFQRTKLDFALLGEIWQIADTENRGFLTPPGFSVALRLIAHCQAGRAPTAAIASQPAPLPKFDGAAGAVAVPEGPRPATPQTIAPQTTGPIRVPPLTADKIAEYQGLFERAGARGGFLSGDAARQMFEKARLPNEVLGQIWGLADVEGRGALNLTEFIVAMHLLTSMRSGALRALPQTLPPGLYEAAGRRGPSAGASPVIGISRQFTGGNAPRPQSPLVRAAQPAPALAAQTTGNDWLVTPQDKAKYDSIFASVDKSGVGYITGEQAVPFFSNSGLPEDTLASIWDLADIRSEGQLNKDEFAVAMYLIKEQRGKTNNRDALPSTLPPRLMPPAMRRSAIPPPHTTAPAFDSDTFGPTVPKSASDDLFGLDALADASPAPQQSQPQQPAAPQQQPPPPQMAPISFNSSAQSSPLTPQQTSFKPFVPTSSFGQGIAVQNTGGSVQSTGTQNRSIPPQRATGAADLLGEADSNMNNSFTDEASELGNMTNQIGTLRTQMQDVQNKKTTTDRDLSATSTQKRELEGRLGAIRSQYEQEVRDVKALEERLGASRTDTKRLQQELAIIQGSHADLSNQHRQIATQLEADQRENASLKQQIQQLNTEVNQIKPQLEKMQSDARQQKGMVAINKKQLATSEASRDKIHKEMANLEQERLERERLERERVEQERVQLEQRQRAEQEQRQRAEQEQRQRMEQEQRQRQEQERAEKERIAHEEAQKAAKAEQARIERERLETENRERLAAEKKAAPSGASRDIGSSFASPAMASPSTNPFFRRSPEPAMGSSMGPSAFSQSFTPTQANTDFDSFFGPDETTSHAIHEEPPSQHLRGLQNEIDRDMSSTPAVAEPPPPPPSQQITSSALPFRSNLARSDSFGSSVLANAPASRSGISNIGTPSQFPGSPSASNDGDRDVAPSSPTTSNFGRLGAGPSENVSRATQPYVASSIPGAFPDDTQTSTPTAGSVMSETFTDAGSDPFGSKADQSTLPTGAGPGFSDNSPAAQALGRSDIERAANHTSAGPSRLGSEFPPIQEFDADESDSDDDDDFVHAVQHAPANHAPAGVLDEHQRSEVLHSTVQPPLDEVPVHEPAVAEIGDDDSVTEELPPLEAQKSPPDYKDAVPPSSEGNRDVNEFPREYTGLLPSRELASSPPQATVQQTPQSIATAIDGDEPSFGSSMQTNGERQGCDNGFAHHSSPFATNGFGQTGLSSQANHTAPPVTHSQPVDDFDSAFDDLDEAKEEDGQQDSFVSANGHGGAEFDPVFDSPGRNFGGSEFRPISTSSSTFGRDGQSSSQAAVSSYGNSSNGAAPSGSAYQPSFAPWLNSSAGSAPTSANMPSSSAPNFGGTRGAMQGPAPPPSFDSPFASTRSAIQGPAPPAAKNSNADWDSMFSGFDNGATKNTGKPAAPQGSFGGFDDDEITPAPMQPPPRTSSAAAPVATRAPAPAPAPAAKPRPPPVGRALTTTGEHDDPLLKSLTNMGFKRDDALQALERFDYNVDAAMDYLTKKR